MLLAFEQGAELIVAVGTHTSMVEFLDKGRPGMASTFLVRMKVGPILVDAKGVSRLYRSRVRKRDLLLMVVAALLRARDHHAHQRTDPPVPAKLLARLALTSRESRS